MEFLKKIKERIAVLETWRSRFNRSIDDLFQATSENAKEIAAIKETLVGHTQSLDDVENNADAVFKGTITEHTQKISDLKENAETVSDIVAMLADEVSELQKQVFILTVPPVYKPKETVRVRKLDNGSLIEVSSKITDHQILQTEDNPFEHFYEVMIDGKERLFPESDILGRVK
jgi:uncharacterized coiled-coil protein SlyX